MLQGTFDRATDKNYIKGKTGILKFPGEED